MNSIKFLSKITLAAGISLALAFTLSCSSNGNNDGNGGNGQGVPFNENSQIYYIDGTLYKGNGVVKMYLRNEEYDKNDITLINIGSVTNGIVKLELPTTIPEKYLSENFHDCEVFPKGAKIYYATHTWLVDNNEKDISLSLGYLGNDYTYFVIFLYSLESATVSCEDEDSKTDIEAKSGWNKVYVKKTYSCDRCDAYYVQSTNDIQKKEKEMKWFIEPK